LIKNMKNEKNRYVPAKKDGRFECSVHEVKEGFFWPTAFALVKSTIKRLRIREQIDWLAPENSVERSQELSVTWIGHSTVLIQIDGVNILTDPIFGAASILFPRVIKPGLKLEQLPPIDVVLISHNHYDHMEISTLAYLAKKNPSIKFLVPQGDKARLARRRIQGVSECLWWESHSIADKATCTFLPAIHWTQRRLRDRNMSLWGSWMIEVAGKTVYFGGDTAFGEHFNTIAQEYPSIDLAILPISPCEPRESMKHAHIDALEAIQAFIALGAGQFIPIHWGTFRFGNEPVHLAIDRLVHGWCRNQLDEAKLVIPKAGKRLLCN
jgi:L-ascorbate metabolism protein UlaG (beta-lactamase superfamily)